jgi:hypothetical protein
LFAFQVSLTIFYSSYEVIIPFINLCFQELEFILEDAQVDYKHLEYSLKATEKERDALDLKLAEKVRYG